MASSGAGAAHPDITQYFNSEFFKLSVNETDKSVDVKSPAEFFTDPPLPQDPKSQRNSQNIYTNENGKQVDAERAVFYIHKALLASLSPEFERHLNNSMIEGTKNTMLIEEVDYPTLRRFLQWAYIKEYTIPNDLPTGASLLIHVKMFILADRFNVQRLMDLSFSRLTADLLKFESITDSFSLGWVLVACAYAFTNLPTRQVFPDPKAGQPRTAVKAPPYIGSDNTAVGAYLIHFIAWKLSLFKVHPYFEQFLDFDRQLAKALLPNVPNAPINPRNYN